jgi:chloramphenicol-sensitive protein RarD
MALGAQLIWGLLPLYLAMVHMVPAVEFVGWRLLFSVPFCLLFIALRRQGPELAAALRNWKVLRMLLLSAVLIAVNWLIYVIAVQEGHIYAASFGYYVAPLFQVLIGTVFLGERLSQQQWIAVTLSGLGVALLARGELSMLWISLALAVPWSCYGLIRRLTPVGAMPGLTVETLLLAPGALGIVIWFAVGRGQSSFGHDFEMSALISLSGLLTAVPLAMFAGAARRMDFTSLGMLQFIGPTIVFLLGLTVFGLPLQPVQIVSFAIIWIAIGLFVWDLWRRRSVGQPPA